MSKASEVVSNNVKVRRKYIIALGIFVFFFVLYFISLTNDHFTVDGATRSLEVFWREEVILHGNNHILYPFNVYSWYKLTSFFLGDVDNPFDFIRRIQAMNALAASIILLLGYFIYLKFLKKEALSLVLIAVFGISNAFFSHAVSSAEPIIGFLFFILSFYLIVSCQSNKNSAIILTISAFIFAYSIMSYLSMVFGLPLILAYIYYKTNSKKKVIGYFFIFFIFFSILFVISAYYKGFTILTLNRTLSGTKFTDPSHTGFKLKNIPQYPFGMINAFFHIDAKYDLPTYVSSIKKMKINSLFSVIFGVILGIIILILILQKGIIKNITKSLTKNNSSDLAIALIYFLSASAVLIGYIPVYDKLWIMGLHSFLLLGGIIYTRLKKTAIIKGLFLIAVLIILFFNGGFAIKSKNTSKDVGVVCVEDSLKLMESKYILLSTWGDPYGKYFLSFYYNNKSRYYKIPNLAMEYGLNTEKVISFLKNEFCNIGLPFYTTSGVLMDKYGWNTFLGDEMRMNYSLFHEKLLDYVHKVTECVYEVNRSICNI